MLSKAIANKSFLKATQSGVLSTQTRGLKMHEYQSAQLLESYNIPVPTGYVAGSPEEAFDVTGKFSNPTGFVIKSQALCGGRGMGHFKETGFQGGVKVVDTREEVRDIAKEFVGNTLVTKQTGEKGLPVNKVFIVEKIGVDKEIYFSITLDRTASKACFIYSAAGGMNIEEVAEKEPEKINKLWIDLRHEFEDSQLDGASEKLGIPQFDKEVKALFHSLYRLFKDKDCDMVEINPLVATTDNRLLACDAKVTIDDNAEYRQKELFAAEDKTQRNEKENLAKEHSLNYIALDGNIGCMVNGAGLAMSTMDIIKLHGGEPANFLDVGGSAEGEEMIEAFKILNGDENIKSIFVNIFGGILKCDELTKSIIRAAREVNIDKPIVLRLKGTNADIARKMIAGHEKDLGIEFMEDFNSATVEVVRLAKEGHI
jgi:succinyl-CoA synthetase beta subunit